MRLLTAFFLFIWVFLPQTLLAEDKSPAKAIIVLDASGSMWGQIGGKAKIKIAREVIAGVLKDWNPDNQIGLIAYGHNKKGDCKDIETLIPVGQLNPNAFNKAVAGLQPKGKTPLTDAVRKAAAELKYTEEKATVILVSDGRETCAADPCAAAKELEQAGIDFTAHVISFGVTEAKGISQLKCLAKNTGGEFLSAENAASLKKALSVAVKKVEKPEPPPKPKKPEKPALKGLHVYTVLSAGGEKAGGSWFTVYKLEGQDDKGKAKRVKVTSNGYKNESRFDLPPGEYVVTAKYGSAYVEKQIRLEPDKGQSVELNYNAGKLRLYTVLTAGADKVGGSWFTVYTEKPDEFGKPVRHKLTSNGYKSETEFIVPAGEYVAEATWGSALANAKVKVEAGKGTLQELDYNAGKLRLFTVMTAGAEKVGGNWFTVYTEKPDEFGKPVRHKLTSNGYKAESEFIVPAGEYVAAATLGSAAAEEKVKVEAGKGTLQELNYNAGRLKVFSVLTAGADKVGGSWFTIFKEKSDEFGKAVRQKVTGNGYKAEAEFVLPQGDYIAQATLGSATAEQKVSVAPAKGTSQELNYNAGKLRVYSVYEAGGKKVGGNWFTVFKEVKDAAGASKRQKVTSNGYGSQADFILPAGAYIVEAAGKGKKGEAMAEVSPGKGVELEIVQMAKE